MQRPADFRLFVDEDDLLAGRSGGKRSGQARHAGTGDQHVAMDIAAGIMIRIVFRRRNTKACGAANDRFIDLVPGFARPHEGLVVEPGGEEGRHHVVQRADIEGERRPAVLRGDLRPVEHFLHGRPHVRLAAGGVARDVEQRIRLFRTSGQNAARTMILERAAEQMHAMRQQRGGDRIALQCRIALAVEGEAGGAGRRVTAGTLHAERTGIAGRTAHRASPSVCSHVSMEVSSAIAANFSATGTGCLGRPAL